MDKAREYTYVRPDWFGSLEERGHRGPYNQKVLAPTGAENIEHAEHDMQPMFTIITNGKPVADTMVSAYVTEERDPTGLCYRLPYLVTIPRKGPTTVVNIALGEHDELVLNGNTEALRNVQFIVGNRMLDSRFAGPQIQSRFPELQRNDHQDDSRTDPLGTVRVDTDAYMVHPLILKDRVHLDYLDDRLMCLILCDFTSAESVYRSRGITLNDHATINCVMGGLEGQKHVNGYEIDVNDSSHVDVYTRKECLNKGCVALSGQATGTMRGSTIGSTSGHSQLDAYDDSYLLVADNSRVVTHDRSETTSLGHSELLAFDHSVVDAHGYGAVSLFDEAQATLKEHAHGTANDNSSAVVQEHGTIQSALTYEDVAYVEAFPKDRMKDALHPADPKNFTFEGPDAKDPTGILDGTATTKDTPRPPRSVADRVAAKAAALDQDETTQAER